MSCMRLPERQRTTYTNANGCSHERQDFPPKLSFTRYCYTCNGYDYEQVSPLAVESNNALNTGSVTPSEYQMCWTGRTFQQATQLPAARFRLPTTEGVSMQGA